MSKPAEVEDRSQRATKTCNTCGETKPVTEFFKDRSRYTPNCKSCRMDYQRQLRATQAQVIPDMSSEEFIRNIDFRAMPDGTGGFHYRWLGPTFGTATRKPHLTALQRFVKEADGHVLEYTSIPPMWCRDEAPWCMNPDHLQWDDELPYVQHEEFLGGDEYGEGQLDGLSVYGPEESRALSLRRMEAIPYESDDEAGTKFLADHGYSADGSVMERPRRKPRRSGGTA